MEAAARQETTVSHIESFTTPALQQRQRLKAGPGLGLGPNGCQVALRPRQNTRPRNQPSFYTCCKITASRLATMKVELPQVQRCLVEERVEEIMQHQREVHAKHGCYVFMGMLTFCTCNNVTYCIDGQHRREAAVRLHRAEPQAEDFKLACEFIQCSDLCEVHEWFFVKNLNTPLPTFLQPALNKVSASLNDRLLELKTHLMQHFSAFLSTKLKCQQPNVHADAFVEEVGRRYGQQLCRSSSAARFIADKNTEHGTWLGEKRDQYGLKSVFDKISKKAGQNPAGRFYLGVYWLKTFKKKIPCALRNQVWAAFYEAQPSAAKTAKGEVPCPCCKQELISQGKFECGHRQSEKHGGSLSTDNLIPLCTSCNRSMGVMHYDEFAKYMSSSTNTSALTGLELRAAVNNNNNDNNTID